MDLLNHALYKAAHWRHLANKIERSKTVSLVICRPNGCTVVSGVVVVIDVGVCNRSQMRTSKCTCLIFGVSIGLDPG